MNHWDDYSGDEWMRPSSSRETQVKVDQGRATRGFSKRPRMEKPPWNPGDLIAGFELQRAIGSGSHGWVYEAREIATDKIVALKLFPHVDPKEAVRAKTGFRRMSKLRHRGLVRLHRIHHEEDLLAFSMERIDGENLVQVLRGWKKLPLEEACDSLLEMLRQVGAALAWTHAHQLVHRDIKPTNLMLTSDGKRFVIIDCDLTGEFEAESDPENIRSYLIWTPMYVAPEVLFRQSYCPASDIFSLGMVALEALRIFSSVQRRRDPQTNGACPAVEVNQDSQEVFVPRDEGSRETDQAHIASAIVGLHKAIPEALIDIVNEMLSPDVSDRPTALSLSRLGRSTSIGSPVSNHQNSSARAHRLTELAREPELNAFRRWYHLVLGGQTQRLHIDGTSGIGKSTFLQLALEELRSQSWPLIFVARCQRFEQRPLQAFSQIADEIVMRYRRGGMEKIFVDSVSESILQRALPGFEEILEVDYAEPPIVTSPTRPGGLEAAMKVLNQLRQMAPVFFVIDDVQWADPDTVNVLDHLQANVGHRFGPPEYQGFGVITVSRADGDRQQQPPHRSITIGPIARELTSVAIHNEAAQYGLELSSAQLESLNDQIEGQPYRLETYLSELSPSGLLYQSLVEASVQNVDGAADQRVEVAPSIEEVWQRRKEQLAPTVAELLNVIVIAGRQVTFDELSLIHRNTALLETELDELAENGLIFRDGRDLQHIRIWHDRLAQQLLTQISAERRRELHRRWAEGLAGEGLSAGRIAEHYDKAGDLQQFVAWAKQAAVQSQQHYAHIETARWHAAVASHTHGDERIESLRQAAESMQRGGRLFEAAMHYRELAASFTGQARLEMELEEVLCFIRSGRFAESIDHLDPMLKRLKLPRRKPVWQTKLSIAWALIRQSFSRTNLQLRETHSLPERPSLIANQIAVCRSLVRPLSLIDNWLAAELNVFNREAVARYGSRNEQIAVLIGNAVFNAYYSGKRGLRAAGSLSELNALLSEADSPAAHGDVRSGMAWVAALNGRWTEAIEKARQSREFYASSELHRGFEIAHTSFCESVAFFQIGDLKSLADMVDDMQAEGSTSNDYFILAMGSFGYSSVGHMMRDDIQVLDASYELLRPSMAKIGDDAFALIVQFEKLLNAIYRNCPQTIATTIDEVLNSCRRSAVYRIQLMKMLVAELTAMASLRLLAEGGTKTMKQFKRSVRSLRQFDLDSAKIKANLVEGIALSRLPEKFSGNKETTLSKAKALLKAAMVSADILHMRPSVLAARDELARIADGVPTTELEDFLRDQGVVDPVALARLYRGGICG
ncbi:serine/threonine-protein kinase [Aporhodopirellula aestuarii]|uniref:non-specific serine/threonine protein kinase n=1 Tax=Aporhodopirellula aestuarii TaxID=2950107 RepID=A0ABT0U2K2_9BACT|nr:serine/threonine-protein kinase [Aporhodopirellula aestuarii]MCM2371028.1 protein kinase [Aporhodopirellula aestuarii]